MDFAALDRDKAAAKAYEAESIAAIDEGTRPSKEDELIQRLQTSGPIRTDGKESPSLDVDEPISQPAGVGDIKLEFASPEEEKAALAQAAESRAARSTPAPYAPPRPAGAAASASRQDPSGAASMPSSSPRAHDAPEDEDEEQKDQTAGIILGSPERYLRPDVVGSLAAAGGAKLASEIRATLRAREDARISAETQARNSSGGGGNGGGILAALASIVPGAGAARSAAGLPSNAELASRIAEFKAGQIKTADEVFERACGRVGKAYDSYNNTFERLSLRHPKLAKVAEERGISVQDLIGDVVADPSAPGNASLYSEASGILDSGQMANERQRVLSSVDNMGIELKKSLEARRELNRHLPEMMPDDVLENDAKGMFEKYEEAASRELAFDDGKSREAVRGKVDEMVETMREYMKKLLELISKILRR